MIKALALSGLETAINNYLRLDPETITKLSKLANKVIAVEVTDWNDKFYVFIDDDGFQLCADHHGNIDITIKGKLFNLIRVAQAGKNSRTVFTNTLSIDGNTELAGKLHEVLRHINIDWEEYLSRLVGDSFAHRITFGLKQVIEYGRETLEKINHSIDVFVHEERNIFPRKADVEKFYHDINTLRDDVERAAARIDLISPSKAASHD